MLLKAKGYDPVIYERNDGPTDTGLSLGSVLTSSPSFISIRSWL